MAFLHVAGLSKRYAGVVALDRVDLGVERGEWLAVAGENGAGKSTLMKILAGIETRDAGRVTLDGRDVAIDSVRAAKLAGIALIPQERCLCGNLSIEEHLELGREPRRRFGFVDRRGLRVRAQAALARVGLEIPMSLPVERLSPGNQQLLEIARALDEQARVLILDEPTSSLTPLESERLFAALAREKARGVAILYVTHRVAEIMRHADRVVALKDGKNSGALDRRAFAADAIVRLMAGRDVTASTRPTRTRGARRFVVEELRTQRFARESLSFVVHAGEIVGLAGLVGAGRTEVLRALFGADPRKGGRVKIDGAIVDATTQATSIAAGIALVPEERQAQGVVLELSVRRNIGLASLHEGHEGARKVFVDTALEKARARTWIERLAVKTRSETTVVRKLSGGNQQKVGFAKWLARSPRVLLLDEPTRGVDVFAKAELHRCIEEAAERGAAVLVSSSELDELLRLCDRILVLHQGAIRGELARDQFSEQSVLLLATGSPVAEGAHG